MEKNKRNIIIAGALIVVLVLLVLMDLFLMNPSRHSAQTAASPAASSGFGNLSALVSMRQNDAVYKDQWKLWEEDWGRNPFVPPATTVSAPEAETEQLVLQGIFWDETNPKAVLNDRVLGQGDALGAYKVMEIKPSSVVLLMGEKKIELRVFQPISSKNASSQ